MARAVVLVMIIVVAGLWVVGQVANTKRIVEKRHATLVAMMGDNWGVRE